MSAIVDDGSAPEPVKVLIALHEGMDTLDAMGPLEVFSQALHEKKNPGAFMSSFDGSIYANHGSF